MTNIWFHIIDVMMIEGPDPWVAMHSNTDPICNYVHAWIWTFILQGKT